MSDQVWDVNKIRYPLKISANRRYFVDQDDKPVLVQGDSPWSLIVGPSPEEAELYMANRRDRGFNAIIVNLIEHFFTTDAPNNYRGVGPFTTKGDLSTPNEEYFKHADWVVETAARYGLQVFLAPVFVGYHGGDHGWEKEMVACGPEKCREYGRYVGRRYRHYDHIFWHMSCDQDPTIAMREVHAMAEGVKEADPRHLMTTLTAPESSAQGIFPGASWLDVNATYSYKLVHDCLRRDYQFEPTKPFVLIESTYEHEHNASEVQMRRQAYWAILCGACGQFMGNYPIWQFSQGWQQALGDRAATDMSHHRRFFESRPWWSLVPTKHRSVLTRGLGECHGLDYLATALTDDGTTLMAYMPTPRKLMLDTSKLTGGSFRVWWFNPRTGESITGGVLPAHSMCPLWPPPDPSGSGGESGDWGLIVDDAAKNLPAPGRVIWTSRN
ncbi:MAG: DUF4038 domain-containing protein [Phycisphaeraceae bacterium]|nr:DUF4038 domain-containing protein [Phycisphaeraceae bacterium]